MANELPYRHVATTDSQPGFARIWPTTSEGIADERARRCESALMLPYRDDDVRRLNLFVAVDTSNREIAKTRRVLPLIPFVIAVDAAALAPEGLSWRVAEQRMGEPTPEQVEAASKAANAVWERSQVGEQIDNWAWSVAAVGDWYLETVLSAAGPVIVGHHPNRVRIEMDSLGLTIVRAVIDLDYTDPPEPDPVTGGYLASGKDHTYRRVLTPTEIRVYLDGAIKEDETGPNILGAVPLVRIRFRKVAQYELSGWSGDGAVDAVAMIDSELSQAQVVGGRHANPILVTTGARVEEGKLVGSMGRALNLPADADVKWLEAMLNGVRDLSVHAQGLLEALMQMFPEFLFVDAGAGSSGLSLSYRATAFTAKMGPARRRFHSGVGRILGMAVALGAGRAWTEAEDIYVVDGGSVLPMDIGAVIDAMLKLHESGLIQGVDIVARMMAEGMIPDDMEPAEYLLQAQVQFKARDEGKLATLEQAAELAERIQRAGDVGELEQPAETDADQPDAGDDAREGVKPESPDAPQSIIPDSPA